MVLFSWILKENYLVWLLVSEGKLSCLVVDYGRKMKIFVYTLLEEKDLVGHWVKENGLAFVHY